MTMLAGSQIRQALDLLGRSRAELSRRASLELDVVDLAEERDGTALTHHWREIAVHRICGCGWAGIQLIDRPSSSARLVEGGPEPVA